MPDLRSKVKLLSEQPLFLKILATVIIPPAFGAITGLALGWSAPVYWSLLVVSVVGGLGAGYEHRTGAAGLLRGAWGALLFASGILAAYVASGWSAVTHLPQPAWVFLVINIVAGSIFGLIGGRARGRAESLAGSQPA